MSHNSADVGAFTQQRGYDVIDVIGGGTWKTGNIAPANMHFADHRGADKKNREAFGNFLIRIPLG